MTAAAATAYAIALLVAIVTPGPAMLATISTGIAKGARPAVALGLGVAVGDVLLASLAMLGLAAAAATFGWLFALVKFAGAAWLVWLGIRMWRAAPAALAAEAARDGGRMLRHAGLGAAVALGNPKAILFHASLMPLLIDIGALGLAEAGLVLAIVASLNLAAMTGFALLAGTAARWLRIPSRIRLINRAGGGAMIGTGALIAAR